MVAGPRPPGGQARRAAAVACPWISYPGRLSSGTRNDNVLAWAARFRREFPARDSGVPNPGRAWSDRTIMGAAPATCMIASRRRIQVGDAMAGSRTTRAGTKRAVGRRRAVGTRDRIIAHLAMVAEVTDPAGMASTQLAEAVGYPGSSVAFAQLLSGMERDGLIAREVRGKRTYRITLADDTAAARAGLLAAGPPAIRPAAVAGSGGRAERGDVPRLTAAGAPGAMAGFDYDELARRLLVHVVRRLAATPADLEQTVAGLERELATAWT